MEFKRVACLAFAALLSIPAAANEANGMIENMSDEERNAAFTQYLRDTNQDCDAVVRNFFQGFDDDRNAFWNVACRNQISYVIMINNDSAGSTRVLSCEVLKAIEAGECFEKF
jgi:hypothetical protein